MFTSFNLKVSKGEFVVVLGHNGSGKSTIAKHINALLTPSSGTVLVDGMDTKDQLKLWDIRSKAGMVFQNPDNQLVATIVEEDVAFGGENISGAKLSLLDSNGRLVESWTSGSARLYTQHRTKILLPRSLLYKVEAIYDRKVLLL